MARTIEAISIPRRAEVAAFAVAIPGRRRRPRRTVAAGTMTRTVEALSIPRRTEVAAFAVTIPGRRRRPRRTVAAGTMARTIEAISIPRRAEVAAFAVTIPRRRGRPRRTVAAGTMTRTIKPRAFVPRPVESLSIPRRATRRRTKLARLAVTIARRLGFHRSTIRAVARSISRRLARRWTTRAGVRTTRRARPVSSRLAGRRTTRHRAWVSGLRRGSRASATVRRPWWVLFASPRLGLSLAVAAARRTLGLRLAAQGEQDQQAEQGDCHSPAQPPSVTHPSSNLHPTSPSTRSANTDSSRPTQAVLEGCSH